MQQAAAAPPPPPAPRRRVYTAVDPRCEWTSTEDADTLVVDVSGFRKEDLKVLYNTGRKLKVAGERQVDGGQWARFLKVFPVPRSYDAGTIQAKMNIESARLLVILPKGTSSSSSSSKDKQKEHHPERVQTLGELMRLGAQEDAGNGKIEGKEQRQDQALEEPKRDHAMTIQDLPKGDGAAAENTVKNSDGGDGNATENAATDDDGDIKGEDKRWWRKITVLHVLGLVLVLSLVGVGATVMLNLRILAGLETTVRVHPKDVGVKHGKHLVDAVCNLLSGGDPGRVNVVDAGSNTSTILHTLTEDRQELLIRSGVLDGDHISIHVNNGVDNIIEVGVAH
ncbi:hypothetical protein U9M48_010074, partial [Paspalum notatum var. saurae]